MPVIVGGVVEKDGKYLLVQEAKARCRGKWNLPAGHLDPGEALRKGAEREILEETGCAVEVGGICQVSNDYGSEKVVVHIVFATRLLREELRIDPAEILDVKWFSYEEILAMRSKLRQDVFILGAIENLRKGIIAPVELVREYVRKS